MNKYHKIVTVYDRDPATKHRTLIEGQYATKELRYLADTEWTWTEKIDGTNIRVHCDGGPARFGGRTDNAQIPVFLFDKLTEMFGDSAALRQLGDVTLYGEGYGRKIQKGGGRYIADGVSFVLFDVSIGDIWLRRYDVKDVAEKLGIVVVPIAGVGTLSEAVSRVQGGLDSILGDGVAEGLVMRPATELRDRIGDRVITKVKHKDFG